ncbi:SDR family NAD(P)-dependent oxidoreductase [Sphingopyxis sp. KK2]|uniref:SDR family NAD(P)-dependent oxidoreductase n=1 Tax=Sphingopyxis sp. KK2 TaxID=1855727 RepID=UPI00097E6647|nr:SDR family oxidoreductase [Sphingopyxis sp. KK2]
MTAILNLGGKVAVITGAASGIGRQTATLFHALGARLLLTDIDTAGLESFAAELGGDVLTATHDVTCEDAWHAVFGQVDAAFGRLDILVNNAGIMMSKPFAEAGVDVLRRQMAINVEGVYMGMHGALPLMRAAIAAGAATTSIVNISSVYGKVGGQQFAAYSATKGAVRGLTKAVAVELAGSGIRVNAVLPGPVATNLGASWDPPTDAEGKPLSPEEGLAAWTRLIPMGRLGDATDIAPLIAFLASDAAAFITGSDFIADGGYTAA